MHQSLYCFTISNTVCLNSIIIIKNNTRQHISSLEVKVAPKREEILFKENYFFFFFFKKRKMRLLKKRIFLV